MSEGMVEGLKKEMAAKEGPDGSDKDEELLSPVVSEG